MTIFGEISDQTWITIVTLLIGGAVTIMSGLTARRQTKDKLESDARLTVMELHTKNCEEHKSKCEEDLEEHKQEAKVYRQETEEKIKRLEDIVFNIPKSKSGKFPRPHPRDQEQQ